MKLHWSRIGSIAPKFVTVNLLIGGIFAMLYAYVYRGVIRELVRRDLTSTGSGGVSQALANAARKHPEVADILRQEQKSSHRRTLLENIVRPRLPADPTWSLSNYEHRSFVFWYLNSLLVQAGMGAHFDHISPAQRAVELVQVVVVLFVNAYVIAASA
jgi:hypothetical protein